MSPVQAWKMLFMANCKLLLREIFIFSGLHFTDFQNRNELISNVSQTYISFIPTVYNM